MLGEALGDLLGIIELLGKVLGELLGLEEVLGTVLGEVLGDLLGIIEKLGTVLGEALGLEEMLGTVLGTVLGDALLVTQSVPPTHMVQIEILPAASVAVTVTVSPATSGPADCESVTEEQSLKTGMLVTSVLPSPLGVATVAGQSTISGGLVSGWFSTLVRVNGGVVCASNFTSVQGSSTIVLVEVTTR